MTAVARPLRVGLLAYGLDRPLSGVTRCALELGRALRSAGGCEVVFLTTYGRGPFRGAADRSWGLPGCARLPGLMLLGGPLAALAARRLRLDLIHDPIGASPFTLGRWAGSFRRVLTIYDAIAFRYPEGYPWLNNLLHRRFVPATLPNVDRVITASEHARSDLAQLLALQPERVSVTPLGVAPTFRPLDPATARTTAARYGLTGPYVLSLGAQQARKNLEQLLVAFANLRDEFPAHRLAIAGPTLWRYDRLTERIAALGLEQAVVRLGYVADKDLAALYSGAEAFAFPSLYEGFGLPVLEAMACGTPVVCSNTTSLPEVAGAAARLFDPTSVGDLTKALRQVLTDRDLRDELRARGLEWASHFTWERAAQATLQIYREVVAA